MLTQQCLHKPIETPFYRKIHPRLSQARSVVAPVVLHPASVSAFTSDHIFKLAVDR